MASSPRPESGGQRKGKGISVRRIDGNDFELVHPRCVDEMRPDYEEGLELCKAGEAEEARDALRYALEGCGDNLWVHVALGRIALDEFRDPSLARGHFGYAYELARRALPRDFSGRLPRQNASNAPLYEAIDGLVACYEALGRARDAADVRAQAHAWLNGRLRPRPEGPA